MRVVHVNTFGEIGGAARAARRLHQGLRQLGVDSTMFVAYKYSTDPTILEYARTKKLWRQLNRRWRRWRISRVFKPYVRNTLEVAANFDSDETTFGADPWGQLPEADIVHLHWIVQFVDYSSFFASLGEGQRLVWTLHDMAPLAGGCHWNCDCRRFTEKCGACPQLGSKDEKDVTREIWLRKQRCLAALKPSQLHVVAPSWWLASEAKRSSLLSRFACSVIPYGLDTNVFAPRDRVAARQSLGIAPEAKVILFAADAINIRRKGLHVLLEALKGLARDGRLLLLSIGRGEVPPIEGIASRHLAPVDDDERLSAVYSAADIFVISSEQDNLPNTVLESISCGVPVAGFEVGGIPDVVRNGITGYLAKPGDVGGLRAVICRMLERDGEGAAMSKTCRSVAVQEYSLEVQARRYIELYRSMES